jgi:hypothetical protein
MFRLINFEKFTFFVIKFKQIISTKSDNILSKLTIIVFSISMFYQIFEVINIYFDYEIVTRFEVQKISYLPKVPILRPHCLQI